MKQSVPLAIALAVLWILLSGHFDALLLGFGVISVVFVSWLAARMHVVDGESYPFGLIPRLSGYWLWLLVEIVKSNFDTARRALGPAAAVRPVVFDHPATQRSDLGLVIHANSITLTPGTVSLELEDGAISVHALHPDVARATAESGMDARVPDR
jgi:multicomponent Na+:H+ antiporter subunit E